MTVSITYQLYLPTSPDRVWTVLTDSAAIEKWLMPNDFEPKLGHQFTFRTQPIPAAHFDGIVRCEVVEVEPPRRLAYTWSGGAITTTVSYRLEPEGAGTRLYFEHSGFDLDNPLYKMAYDGMNNGWKHLWTEGFAQAVEQLAA
jgi:uncharacterized protein YndB with AHSA1/START domain